MTKLGGVPMGVPIPPTLAAKAIPRRRGTLRASLRLFWMTAMAIGSIIRVVAVLEIHILRKAVATMKPRMRNFSPGGQALTIIKAIRRWAPLFSMALDKRKPPSRRRTSGCPYFSPTTLGSRIPKSGSKERGRREATGMGTASKIHQRAVHRAIPRVMAAGGSSHPNSQTDQPIRTESRGAAQSIKVWEPWVGFSLIWFSWIGMLDPTQTNQDKDSEFILLQLSKQGEKQV